MLRKNTVAIVNQELVPVLKSNRLTQLLQRPRRTRMRSDVTMDQASAAVLDHHKYVQQLKRRGDGDEEITRNDPLGMQTEERRPAHISSRPTRRTSRQVLVHRSGRDLNSQVQQEFIGVPTFFCIMCSTSGLPSRCN